MEILLGSVTFNVDTDLKYAVSIDTDWRYGVNNCHKLTIDTDSSRDHYVVHAWGL